METKQCALGIDLGGTKIELAIVDELGQIVRSNKIPTQAADGAEQIQNRIVEAAHALSQDANLIAVGVGVAGQIDSKTGTVFFAPNLNWHNVPLQANLSKKLKLPVAVTNDVRAAAINEWHFGAAKDCQDFICVFAGTGIGGGIVSGGKLIEGSSNTAGEIGHMVVDMNGPSCTCGSFGCMEAIGSGWAIAKFAKESLKTDSSQAPILLKKCDSNIDTITAKIVFEAALDGDSLSQRIIEKATSAIVSGSVSLVNALNPARLIFGGSISDAIPNLLAQVEQGIRSRALKAAQTNFQVVRAQSGKDAGVIGAATYALIKEREKSRI